jgi:flagellar protein FliO/FliZ
MIKHFRNLSLFLMTTGMVVFSSGSIHAADAALDSMGSYFRVIWGLLVVLGIILILYGIFRKRLSLFHSQASQSINILELKPLMSKKALCLVEVKGEEYLLGISSDRITHIATVSSKKDSSFAAALSRTENENLQ